MQKPNIVSVQWFDGYLEEFECSEVRFGAYLLWMRLINKKERIIPLTQVRWFSQSIESHQSNKTIDPPNNPYIPAEEASAYLCSGGVLYTNENHEVIYEDGSFFEYFYNGHKRCKKPLQDLNFLRNFLRIEERK
jgi:hypothetical protein